MNDLIQIKENLSKLIGKKFNEVFEEEVILSRNKWNSALDKIINSNGLIDITLRVVKVDINNKPYEQSTITNFSDDLSELISSEDFIDSFKGKIENMIFIFIYDNKDKPTASNVFKSFLVLNDSNYLINILRKDYEIINRRLEEKIDKNKNIESVKLECLVFKPKDSKPYKPLEFKGEIITDKRYGWYFTKKFLNIVYNKSQKNVKFINNIEKNKSILEYEFYKYIRKLKKSSRAAIANLDPENKYTQYMHVPRLIEKDFISIVENAITNKEKKLIFLVGNSGDGKSELLRILKNSRPDIYDRCIIHNDATESFYVNKDSLYTLYEILKPFKDENIENGKDCLIVAINMGIIGRLIDSADKNGYSILKEKIINSSILKDNSYKNENYYGWFDYLSFAEYSNFDLMEKAFDVSFIDKMFDKVFSENPDNIFREAFKKLPTAMKNTCPVAANYKLISQPRVRSNIIHLVLYVHLIGRVMITPRIIWNFIYHLLMGTEVERMYNEGRQTVMEDSFFIENIFYNKWYTKGTDNNIFEEIRTNNQIFKSEDTKHSFLNELAMIQSNDKKLSISIRKIIGENNIHLQNIILKNIIDNNTMISIGIKTLIRHNRFVKKSLIYSGELSLVNDFAVLLYDYNNGINSLELRGLEKNLIKIIKRWNGKHYKENSVYIQNDFAHFRKSVKFEDDNIRIRNKKNIFDDKFYHNEILFEFHESGITSVLEIDFKLFSIIKKVENGYRLNLYERLDSIQLQEFINNIIKNQKSKYKQVIDYEKESFIIKDKKEYYEFKRG